MDVVSTDQTKLRLEKWIPEVDVKKDHIQMTFPLPLQHLPALRCVLYRRYVQEWGSQPECTVEWTDRTQHPVTVLSLPPEYLSIENIPKSLPHELHNTLIQLNRKGAKLVTLTAYYTTGTCHVQGNLSRDWMDTEFANITSCVHNLIKLLRGQPTERDLKPKNGCPGQPHMLFSL
jgi:hypothetical protein